jgi:hypothetical protein
MNPFWWVVLALVACAFGWFILGAVVHSAISHYFQCRLDYLKKVSEYDIDPATSVVHLPRSGNAN